MQDHKLCVLFAEGEGGGSQGRVWLQGSKQRSPGLIGFAMSARKEPKGELLRCIFHASDSSSDGWVESCRKLDLFHNMILNGRNGSQRTIEVTRLPENPFVWA